MEKKLTDEEIVKALELCISEDCHCKNCAFHGICLADGNDTQLLVNALDLIHRLQVENERLTEELHIKANEADWRGTHLQYMDEREAELEKKNAELQKEVERLSLIAGIVNKGVAVEIVNMQETIDKQKAEIERLTEESDEMFCRHAKENQAASILIEKRNNEITELQKQVDELTERAERAEEIANVYQSESTTKCWVDYAVRQAVKDTAKEIYHLIDMFPIPTRQGQQRYATGFEHALSAIKLKIAERYGVEVE